MKRFFGIYQYAMPLILCPIAYYLWLRRFGQSHLFALYGIGLPVITAYVVPGIGTNILRLWEFNTKLRLGKFRLQHGFVFGTASALLVLTCPMPCGIDPGTVFSCGFVMAAVIGFWNWIYDIAAISAGHIRVYNRQCYEGEGPEAIATDYAPAYFGTFGFVYGMSLKIGHYYLLEAYNIQVFWIQSAIFLCLCLVLPAAVFCTISKWKNGYSGIRPYRPRKDEHI